MIVSDLFEDIPIASGDINPNTGRVWLPSELRAAFDDEQKIKQAEAEQRAAAERAAAAAEVAKYPTSSTAPAPTSVTYKNLIPKKKVKSDFTQRTGVSYKLPGTPTVPTVPNMTQAPAKPSAPAAEPSAPAAPAMSTVEPSAMGNMARQLAAKGQAQTSTGGATIATGTGIRHAASPVNPNQTSQTAEKIAVNDITNQVNRQLKLVKTKDDLKKIKQLIDRQFTKHGLVSESAFAKRDQLIEHATKILENRSN